MKKEYFDERPIIVTNSSYHRGLNLIEEFYAQPKPYAVYVWEEGDPWNSPTSMINSLRNAIKYSGRPVKIRRADNKIILEKVVQP